MRKEEIMKRIEEIEFDIYMLKEEKDRIENEIFKLKREKQRLENELDEVMEE